MNRRSFLAGMVATASGLLLPHERRRVYSFGSVEWLRDNSLAIAVARARRDGTFVVKGGDYVLSQQLDMTDVSLYDSRVKIIGDGFLRYERGNIATFMSGNTFESDRNKAIPVGDYEVKWFILRTRDAGVLY